MNNNNLFKYIFAAVVIFLVSYTIYVIAQNKSETNDLSLDQTSTVSNIQTDLRFAISEIDTINPIISHNRNVQEVTKMIYDPLVTLNENYKLEYCLAEEIAKTDDVTYIVKIRKGVLWENRTNITAYDVQYTINLIKNMDSLYSDNLRSVIQVEVPDSSTIIITLSEPVQFFEYNLTFPIMSQEYYGEDDFAASDKIPVASGMFRIAEVSENMIKLVPNEHYWNANKTPMVKQINVNLYGTIGEAYSAFKNGEIDALFVKINDVENYVGTLGYNKIEFKSREYDFLSFNTASEILSEQAVRKAISYIIDKNNIIASCLGSGYVASNFSLDMGCWLYTRDLNINPDTEQAKQILAVNGWEYTGNSWQKKEEGRTKRLTFTLTVNTNNEARVRVAENIKGQLADFGIPVNIKYLDSDGYADAINNKNYEAILTGIRTGYSPNLETFFADDNLANFYNVEVSELMKSISNTTDDNTLYSNYGRLFEIYLEEVPYIGLYRNTDIIIVNQNLVSNMTANSFNLFHNIEKWYRQ